MKKILILFSLFFIVSCGVTYNIQGTVNNYTWFPVNMKPSQVDLNGAVFYTADLKNNESVSVYNDDALHQDGNYYRNELWKSYGWTVGTGSRATASAYASAPSNSTLYISIKRGVAIYIYPDGKFQVFKAEKQLL
jgi:hypothetical protein